MEENQDAPIEQKDPSSLSLGGNIQLNGFQNVEKAKMIVLKKLIGNYVRQIQEKKSDYEKIKITLEEGENNAKIRVDLIAGGNQITSESQQKNVFIAIDESLKKISEGI